MFNFNFNFNFKKILIWMCFASSTMLISCSSTQKAELNASTPPEAIQEVEVQQQMLIAKQLDLFLPKVYKQGVDKLNKAKKSLRDQENASKTMSLAAQAKALFEEVENNSDKKNQVPSPIIEARKSAVNAISQNDKLLSYELMKVDNELRAETDTFSEGLDNSAFTDIQKKYLFIEVKGVQNQELAACRQVIERAEGEDAKKLAPKTLKNTKRALVVAENSIAANINNPPRYDNSVIEANESAKLLHDVMNKSHEMGKGTSEKVSLKLVYQDRKIGKLSNNIDDLEDSLNNATAESARASKRLSKNNERLEDVSREVRFQNAMNQARKDFSVDEASVYQQGNHLIIRLKKMDFASGSARLPGSSMKLLSKVDGVIRNIGAESVRVQGHTDSIGSESTNMKLSKARANSVAKYLKSVEKDLDITQEGFGELKPLASNNSKSGRSLNRRVDIVVTALK